MHSGELNRLLNNVPAYPAEGEAAIEQAADDETQNQPKASRGSQFMKAAAKGIGVATLAITPPLVQEIVPYMYGTRSTIAPEVEGCAGVPPQEDLDPVNIIGARRVEQFKQIEAEAKDKGSAAGEFRPVATESDRIERGANRPDDILLVPGNFTHELSAFTMESTGIHVRVLTDQPASIEVRPDVIEQMFNTPMERWDIFVDDSIRDFFYCAKQKLLDNQEASGTTLSIYLPSQPNYYIDGAYARGFTEQRPISVRTGFDIPNLKPFGIDMLPHKLFISGTSTSVYVANLKITGSFMHEAIHEMTRLVDAQPLLHKDEEFALQAEKQIMALFYDGIVQAPFAYDQH